MDKHRGHNKQPDHTIWAYRITQDDRKAFQQLFECYYAGLCVFAKRYIEDLNTREDLVQDVFCSIWLNRKRLDFNLPIRNYLLTSVRNHCLNYLRDNHLRTFEDDSILDAWANPEEDDEVLLLNEMEDMLTVALSKLPLEYRLAFELSRMEGKSTTEIAEQMHVSVRTVERYRNKAIELLKNELKDYLPLLLLFLSGGH